MPQKERNPSIAEYAIMIIMAIMFVVGALSSKREIARNATANRHPKCCLLSAAQYHFM